MFNAQFKTVKAKVRMHKGQKHTMQILTGDLP